MINIVHVDQRWFVENGIDIDFIDAALFEFMKKRIYSKSCERVRIKNTTWYCVNHKEIIDNMPMIGVKSKNGVIKRINKLVDAKLIKKCPDANKHGKSMYKFGYKYVNFFN